MKIKMLLIAAVWLSSISVMAQPREMQGMQAWSGKVRMQLAKANIKLPEEHDENFWLLYGQYVNARDTMYQHKTFHANSSIQFDQISDRGSSDDKRLPTHDRLKELDLRQQYFDDILKTCNGGVALQFLQTEELLDLLTKSIIYERSFSHKPVMDFRADGHNRIKRSALASVLTLPEKQSDDFWNIYTSLEKDIDMVWGEDLTVLEQYIGNPYEFTPAQAKRIGEEFLKLQRGEILLREKYFDQTKEALGLSFTTRFIALEDYISTLTKLKLWSTSFLINP